jgi:C1A family cysteine protease
MGWLRDNPDYRDYHAESDEIGGMLKGSRAISKTKVKLAPSIDLSKWCSPIEDQGQLGSCTANAAVGLMEYYESRAFGEHLDASRLFIYKTTRNLLQVTGDTGAWLRTTMKAMTLFGAPPEKHWPYVVEDFEEEPAAFHYSFGANYQSVRYYRLDHSGISGSQLVARVKSFLAAGYPSMFGFTVYNFGNDKGEFAFPGPGDSVQGGHAVVAIGYDDARKIGSTKGALKIRNSWGTAWGEGGYGWLPYEYVESGLAVDFWSLFKQEYVGLKKFD